jgi:hypothetical protein
VIASLKLDPTYSRWSTPCYNSNKIATINNNSKCHQFCVRWLAAVVCCVSWATILMTNPHLKLIPNSLTARFLLRALHIHYETIEMMNRNVLFYILVVTLEAPELMRPRSHRFLPQNTPHPQVNLQYLCLDRYNKCINSVLVVARTQSISSLYFSTIASASSPTSSKAKPGLKTSRLLSSSDHSKQLLMRWAVSCCERSKLLCTRVRANWPNDNQTCSTTLLLNIRMMMKLTMMLRLWLAAV